MHGSYGSSIWFNGEHTSLAENLHGWAGGGGGAPESPKNILVSNYYFSLPTWLVTVIVLIQ